MTIYREMEKRTEKLTPQQAKPKIEYYCQYQERCHQEVAEKLYSYGLSTDDVNFLLSGLVKGGFLNEERFAKAFAGGKFRQKQWGRNRIVRELKAKKVSDFCIRKALLEIDDDAYLKTLVKLAEKYNATLKDKLGYIRKQKVLKHLVSKGYEYDICMDVLGDINDL
jgi:regulatory protein